MKSEEERGKGENELKKIREQLFQIKLILVAILLLLLAPFVGPGPVLQMILIGLMGLAAIYAGLLTFDGLVKRKVGQDWGEAQLASFLDGAEEHKQGKSEE
jgi:hypothetical protein